MTQPITGLWAACATPLELGGGVDRAALARHGRRLLGIGCDGQVRSGTTGEGPSFTAAERLATAAGLLASGIQAGQLALGAGGPAADDTAAPKAILAAQTGAPVWRLTRPRLRPANAALGARAAAARAAA